jgi:iron complex transport system substrate-binding protein
MKKAISFIGSEFPGPKRPNGLFGPGFLFLLLCHLCLLSLLFYPGCDSSMGSGSGELGSMSGGPEPKGPEPGRLEPGGDYPGFPLTFRDSAGKTITLRRPPERVVSLNRQTSEVMVLLGAGGLIVGTGDNTKRHNPYLGLGSLPEVGSGELINVEAIVSLRPDVVFVPVRRSLFLDAKLIGAGIKVIRMDNFFPEKEDEELLLLGRILSREREASLFLAWKESVRAISSERLSGLREDDKKTVAALSMGFLLSNGGFRAFPSVMGDGAMGSGEGYSSILAGGLDAFPEISLPLSQGGTAVGISPEYLLMKNPEFVTLHGSFLGGYDAKGAEELKRAFQFIKKNSPLSRLRAGERGEVHFFHTDLLGASKRDPGVLKLSSILYPERYEGVDPDLFLKEYFERFLGVPFKGIWYYGGEEANNG